MKILYVINTKVGYEKPLENMLDSIAKYMPHEHAIIYKAGIVSSEYSHNWQIRCAPLNSYDYTGLIELTDRDQSILMQYTHIFCLQDTMVIGPKTHTLICAANPYNEATAAKGFMCDLVLYRTDFLLHRKHLIQSMRNITKLDSIIYEGMLWKLTNERHEYTNADVIERGWSKPYSNIDRLEEYYTAIDVTKMKANNGSTMSNLVLEP